MAVLREFLVAITYKVNNANAFNASMKAATTGFSSLSKVAASAGAAVTAVVGKMSDDLDRLYFISQRTKASADNIAALGYAARQAGSSADAMVSSIESVASRMRRLPGLTQMLGNMGIDGRGDPTTMMLKLYQRLSNKPEWLQLQYADLFGIDEKTWLALKNMGAYIEERKNIARSMGVDMDKAAKAANSMWTQLRRLGTTIEVMASKVVQSLGERYGQSFRNFTDNLIRNGDKIGKAIETIVDLFLRFAEAAGALIQAFGRVGMALYEWFERLDPAIQKVILGLGALLVAWRVLNAGILATPLGRVLALIAAAVALVEDYLVWKERGQGENGSLFDWSWADDNIFTKIGELMKQAGEYAKAGWQWLIDITDWFRNSSMGRRLIPQQNLRREGDSEWDPYGRAMQGESLMGRAWRGLQGMFGRSAQASQYSPAQMESARRISRTLEDMGYSPAQRAAILSSIGRESGFNPMAENWETDRQGRRFLSFGLLQYNRERLEGMMRYFGVTDPRQLTEQQQLLYHYYEMTQGSERGRAGRFMGATTPGAAAEAHTQDLIRPYDPAGDERRRRGIDAEEWLRRLGTPTGGVAPGTVASDPGGRDQMSSVEFSPTTYINVTAPDAPTAAAMTLAGQDNVFQTALRNLRPRII